MPSTSVETEQKIVGLPLVGQEIERFMNQKVRRHLRADAECARQLLMERIEQLEKEQANGEE